MHSVSSWKGTFHTLFHISWEYPTDGHMDVRTRFPTTQGWQPYCSTTLSIAKNKVNCNVMSMKLIS